MKKSTLCYDTTAPLSLEIDHEHFKEKHNPIFLMTAFRDARKYNIPVPEWVLEGITAAFNSYLNDPSGKITLDTAFGCTHVGRKKARDGLKLRGRNLVMALAVEVLRREENGKKGSITKACLDVQEFCRSNKAYFLTIGLPELADPVSKSEIRQIYYAYAGQLRKVYELDWNSVLTTIKSMASDLTS